MSESSNQSLPIKIQDIAAYKGPHQIPGIRFRAVRQALGIAAWGMNILELDPHCDRYPEHDHREDQQEEVYLLLSGQAQIVIDTVSHQLEEGHLIRVAPSATRKISTGEEGATILALGGTPGRAYEPGSSM